MERCRIAKAAQDRLQELISDLDIDNVSVIDITLRRNKRFQAMKRKCSKVNNEEFWNNMERGYYDK